MAEVRWIVQDGWFRRPSALHGRTHTQRVLELADRVVDVVRGIQPIPDRLVELLRLAVAIHDTERTHDGICPDHGLWAAQRRRPWLERVLVKGPLDDPDWETIAYAVTHHCHDELPPAPEDHHLLAQLLKAADALDRVRLAGAGEAPQDEVDVGRLAWPELKVLVPEAVELLKTHGEPVGGMHRNRRWKTSWNDPEGWDYLS